MREVDLKVCAAELANDAFVIDVHEPDEYGAGHVPGARLAPCPRSTPSWVPCPESGPST